MTPITYVAHLRPEVADGYLVSFPDVPEALTAGATIGEAEDQAYDALAMALRGYLEAGHGLPPVRGDEPPDGMQARVIAVDPLVAAAFALREAMEVGQVTGASLAARLGCSERSVWQMLHAAGNTSNLAIRALSLMGKPTALAI